MQLLLSEGALQTGTENISRVCNSANINYKDMQIAEGRKDYTRTNTGTSTRSATVLYCTVLQ